MAYVYVHVCNEYTFYRNVRCRDTSTVRVQRIDSNGEASRIANTRRIKRSPPLQTVSRFFFFFFSICFSRGSLDQ